MTGWAEEPTARKLVDEIVAETSERHDREGSKPLGVKAVLDQDPHDLPHNSNRIRAPLCHANDRERRIDFAVAYSAFIAAYRRASDLIRSGKLDAQSASALQAGLRRWHPAGLRKIGSIQLEDRFEDVLLPFRLALLALDRLRVHRHGN